MCFSGPIFESGQSWTKENDSENVSECYNNYVVKHTNIKLPRLFLNKVKTNQHNNLFT